MTCFFCKGDVQDGFSTFTADKGGCIIVVKNVPAQICDQCGEASYSNTVAQKLEQIIQHIKNSAAEVTVVSYSEKAA
jgi:YgiT-type zinc finger domain-containing protein